jgi:hypothetical protein
VTRRGIQSRGQQLQRTEIEQANPVVGAVANDERRTVLRDCKPVRHAETGRCADAFLKRVGARACEGADDALAGSIVVLGRRW